MIFALRFPPPYTNRRLSLRKPERYSSLSTPNYSVHRIIIAGFARLSTIFRGKRGGKVEKASRFPQKGAFLRNFRPYIGERIRPTFFLILPKRTCRARYKKKALGTNARYDPLLVLCGKSAGFCPATVVSPLLLRRAFRFAKRSYSGVTAEQTAKTLPPSRREGVVY